jgi:hypothetical protein
MRKETMLKHLQCVSNLSKQVLEEELLRIWLTTPLDMEQSYRKVYKWLATGKDLPVT